MNVLIKNRKKCTFLPIFFCSIIPFYSCNNSQKSVNEQNEVNVEVEVNNGELVVLPKHPLKSRTVRYERLGEYETEETSYNRLGLDTAQYLVFEDSKSLVLSKEYDNSGRILKETSYSLQGKECEKTLYIYGDNGKLQKRVRICEMDSTLYEYEYINTKSGYVACSEEEYFDMSHLTRKKITIKDADKIIENREYLTSGGNDREVAREKHTYNNNTLCSDSLFRLGELVRTRQYDFDERGNETRCFTIIYPTKIGIGLGIEEANDTILRTREYTYDGDNHYIVKISINGKLLSTEETILEYW